MSGPAIVIDHQSKHLEHEVLLFEINASLALTCANLDYHLEVQTAVEGTDAAAKMLRTRDEANAALYRTGVSLCLYAAIWDEVGETDQGDTFDVAVTFILLQGAGKTRDARLFARTRTGKMDIPAAAIERLSSATTRVNESMYSPDTQLYQTKLGRRLSSVIMAAYDNALQESITRKLQPTQDEAGRAAYLRAAH